MRKRLILALICAMVLSIALPGNIAFAEAKSAAWKGAYQDLIKRELTASRKSQEPDALLYVYTLYDIDKDGIPELFLRFGESTVFQRMKVFSSDQKGKTALLKEYGCGGDYLAAYPDANGILRCHARMNSQSVMHWEKRGNVIKETGPIFREDVSAAQYTEIGEIVAGSVELAEFQADDPHPLLRYEDWSNALSAIPSSGGGKRAADQRFPNNDRAFFTKVINGEISVIPGMVSKTSCYDYWSEPEHTKTSFSAFFQFMAQELDRDYEPEENTAFHIFYSDLDGDGQLEAICSLIPGEMDNTLVRFSIILSEQAGTVYAYGRMSEPVTGVDSAGILYSYFEEPIIGLPAYPERACKLYFDEENAFLVYVPLMNYDGKRGTFDPNASVMSSAAPRQAEGASAERTSPCVPLACGAFHTIGLKADGTVVAVGSNSAKQSKVSGWTDIIALAASGSYVNGQKADYSVGLCSDGTVVATGVNTKGQCDVSDWEDIIAIAAGGEHTVGLKSDGTVVATGSNKHGQCNVSGWKDIVAVAAGEGYCPFTLGLKANGHVVATGNNKFGACDVQGWKGIVAIAAGGDHAVGLKSDGTVVATGWNDEGQCRVSKWKDIVAIAAGAVHTVGLKSDGTVVATGLNNCGQCRVTKWRDISRP